ncbi:flagellar motor switch protein FliN/FliY [Pararhizobium capsulatum DSM 1112]|uniref:Flagellar motor switch protein FliN n=2 Tax=Pararhizobium capsulatum TaxID=34014 RepID=A0ABU0BLM3_9HYPH|nr:flagellar motor switch protein FliN/FliY [Pararhizobium capsulatum DSM 1112]
MATKKAPIEDLTNVAGGDAELDRAIDDLRGVLKSDTDGGAPAGDFGMDFADTSAGTTDFASTFDASTSDLGSFGGDFGSTSFGGLDDTPSSGGFGNDFGASSFDSPSSSEPGSGMASNLDLIMDIPIDVQIVLGSSRMQVSSLMGLSEGATIALDRRIGEPVDIVVNGRMIGRGEITVLEEDDTRFGVKLIEIKGTSKS